MPHTVDWHDPEQTIILRTLSGDWGWEEFVAGFDEIFARIRSVPHTVDVILDDSAAGEPPGVGAMTHFGRIWSSRPPNLGAIIIVGAGEYMRIMGESFAGAFAADHPGVGVYVTSLDEALEKLDEIRAGR
jgi:hypothetical protein